MVTFQVPYKDKGRSYFASFSLGSGPVLFAGSRRGYVHPQVCSDLITAFASHGLSFLTGCAPGVDACFRKALVKSDFTESSLVACAFKERADRLKGLYNLFVVPDHLSPRAALAKRTLWMTSRCSLLILFPSDPITRGSALAFKSAIIKNKPVFVISKTRPTDSDLYSVYPTSLFGVVQGFWCVPPVYAETGLSYED